MHHVPLAPRDLCQLDLRVKIGEQADRSVAGLGASQLVHSGVGVLDFCGPKGPRLGCFPPCSNQGLSPDASDGQESGSMGLASHILRFEVGKNILETICSQWTGLRDRHKLRVLAKRPGSQ